MEDPIGYMRFQHLDAGKQFARAPVRHWHEYEQLMPVTRANTEAQRCLDCGTPHCHRYCPVHNLIPDWNTLLSENDWRTAWLQLESTNNFPEFTGRICGAPCEDACTLSISNRPVTIRAIELAIVEQAWKSGWIKPQPVRRKLFKRVVIVGSGPAGLACAQQLVRVGYRVTIYEKSNRAGGLLRFGIPDFRLEKAVLDRRLAQLHAEGVRFRTGVHVGVDVEFEALQRHSHAVVLACGAEQPRTLAVPGRALNGIHYAMEYLVQQNHRVAGDFVHHDLAIDAAGKQVAVIGGGDTGGDCVGTAIRQGARQVTQIQYHDRLPDRVDNLRYWPQPVPEWHAGDHDAEGCRHIWGHGTVAFTGRGGQVDGLILQKLCWLQGTDGCSGKHHLPGQVRHLPAQLVLLAMGYAHPVHTGLLRQLPSCLDGRGNIDAPEDNYMTRVNGVFACGDARRGQSQVVWAIREGRQCARAVDSWLSGDSLLPAV